MVAVDFISRYNLSIQIGLYCCCVLCGGIPHSVKGNALRRINHIAGLVKASLSAGAVGFGAPAKERYLYTVDRLGHTVAA